MYQFKELTCYSSYQFKPDPQSLEFDFNSPHSVPVNTLRGVPDLRFDLLLPLICSYQFDFAFAQCRERTIPAITYLASPRLSPSITAPRLSHSQSLALASPPLISPSESYQITTVQRVSRLDLLSAQNSLNLVFAQNSFDQHGAFSQLRSAAKACKGTSKIL